MHAPYLQVKQCDFKTFRDHHLTSSPSSFGWMKANKLTSFDSTDETKNDKKGTYERVVELKKKNPNLKVLLAVGTCLPVLGGNFEDNFSKS